MNRAARLSPCSLRLTSTSAANHLSGVRSIIIKSSIDKLQAAEFRREAFGPQKPRLITVSTDPSFNTVVHCSIPAARKWFIFNPDGIQTLNVPYLEPYGDVLLPYELTGHPAERPGSTLSSTIKEPTFQRLHAPLSLFLSACRVSQPPRLYIAQAQLLDLPQPLRDDLPTPHVVLRSGKGDIYDANIWMGIPPTYTPLHKDPNPNLFIQLASNKLVRLFKPATGAAIFRQVQEKIQRQASETFRGDEMMQGPESTALEDAVWNCPIDADGLEVIVRPGDALFIPQGWWHSVKSMGAGVTASVCIYSL